MKLTAAFIITYFHPVNLLELSKHGTSWLDASNEYGTIVGKLWIAEGVNKFKSELIRVYASLKGQTCHEIMIVGLTAYAKYVSITDNIFVYLYCTKIV